jgi:FAD/FMN-containing dehydrogenase
LRTERTALVFYLSKSELGNKPFATERKVTNLSGEILNEAKIDEFTKQLQGPLLRPGDEGYEASRKIYNAMINKHPALIVKCSGVADVIKSVNFARENKLLLAIRGGGHNVAGNALCDGGLVIDFSNLKNVWVDPKFMA